MKYILFLAFFALSPLLSAAEDSTCLDPQDVQRILSKFRITVERNNNDYCDLNNYNRKMVEALLLMDGLDLSGPEVNEPWNQNILPNNWLSFAHSRASILKGGSQYPYDPNYCSKEPGPGAFVLSPALDPHWGIADTTYFCSIAFSETIAPTELLTAILHEARHHEGFAHVVCSDGTYKGSLNCDSSISKKGSYAVSVESYAKLAVSAKNIHPSLKEISFYYAVAYTDRFNNKFIDSSEYALLQDVDGDTYVFDGKNLILLPGDLIPEGTILMRSQFGMVVIPEDKSSDPVALKGYSAIDLLPSELEGDFAIKYKQSNFESRSQYKDLIYGYSTENFYYAELIDNTVSLLEYQISSDPILYIIEGPWSEAIRLFIPEDYNASAKNRVYVLDNREELYRIEFRSGKHSITRIENPAPGIRAITTLGEVRYGLNREGKLMRRVGTRYQELEEFKDLRFKSLSRSNTQSVELGSLQKQYEESVINK